MAKTVLVIGAHPDDEVLGAGGTLAKHADKGHNVHVLIVTEGTTAQYDDPSLIEQKREEARRCAEHLGLAEVHFADLPDLKLDTRPHIEVNSVLEEYISKLEPDIVYTHSPHEVNKDHQALYESTLVATRPGTGVSKIYAYETLSSTEWTGGGEDQFTPHRYVNIDGYVDTKIEAFHEYETEVRDYPHPRSEKAIRSRARCRGTEAGFKTAEAFSVVVDRVSEL